jgi:2-keto-4-pentenoate hydratase/2-oxohepta-3-ene-1,7-dioic acid hydratase in catechol pathway
VPAAELDKVLRVQTHVNGEIRQDATTEDLIFSISTLIKTLSEGQTLMPGDVLATGTVSSLSCYYTANDIAKTPPSLLESALARLLRSTFRPAMK